MSEFFPAQLPDRPQKASKFGLAKLLSSKFERKKKVGDNYATDAYVGNQSAVFTDLSTYPDEITQQKTHLDRPIYPKKSPLTRATTGGLLPKAKHAVSSLRHSKSARWDNSFPDQVLTSPYPYEEQDKPFRSMQSSRKKPQLPDKKNLVKDWLNKESRTSGSYPTPRESPPPYRPEDNINYSTQVPESSITNHSLAQYPKTKPLFTVVPKRRPLNPYRHSSISTEPTDLQHVPEVDESQNGTVVNSTPQERPYYIPTPLQPQYGHHDEDARMPQYDYQGGSSFEVEPVYVQPKLYPSEDTARIEPVYEQPEVHPSNGTARIEPIYDQLEVYPLDVTTDITQNEAIIQPKPHRASLASVQTPTTPAVQQTEDWELAERLQQEEIEAYELGQELLREELRSITKQDRNKKSRSRKKTSLLGNLEQSRAAGGKRHRQSKSRPDTHDASTTYSPCQVQSPEFETLPQEPGAQKDKFTTPTWEELISMGSPGPSPTRDCAVCGDSQPISSLPSLANCTHIPETCADCYTEWITSQLTESSWREVKCPGSKCKIKLTYHEIQAYALPENFQQYDTYIARTAFNDDPNFRWCRSCDYGQIHLSGVEGNIFTCANCGHKVCVIHENTWHEGETCEEFDYRSSGRKERDQKAQEKASLKAISKLSKKCPGPGCVYNIEKNDGCDRKSNGLQIELLKLTITTDMTCSKCRYEFCWVCLCDYDSIRTQGNSAHANSCKYHSRRLN
ncbi:hypothetical protein IQ07DRAFT_18408 [Pyrenochaeta sp. DS3sAY3a]|nr:hypothetical protein IQ07DRAFT_18408 [Pyrenochaeta sp. DS3sAY3a]